MRLCLVKKRFQVAQGAGCWDKRIVMVVPGAYQDLWVCSTENAGTYFWLNMYGIVLQWIESRCKLHIQGALYKIGKFKKKSASKNFDTSVPLRKQNWVIPKSKESFWTLLSISNPLNCAQNLAPPNLCSSQLLKSKNFANDSAWSNCFCGTNCEWLPKTVPLKKHDFWNGALPLFIFAQR